MIRLLLTATFAFALAACNEPATFEARVERFEPANGDRISITSTFENNGELPADITCGITLKESASVVDQDEIHSGRAVRSEGSRSVTQELPIELDATQITEIEVKSCTAAPGER